MTIPDYQTLMLPVIRLADDGREHSLREAIEEVAESLQLSQVERNQLLPSGQRAVLDNRVGWAQTYLKKAGLLEATRRGHFRITARGKQVLS
jgi:restriction system protein